VLAAICLLGVIGGSATAARASLITPSTDAAALAGAMSSQPGLVAGAEWPSLGAAANPSSGQAAGIGNGFAGLFMPTSGSTFAVLTNGDVTLADPPNDTTAAYTDNGTSYGGANDVTILRVNVNVPQGANCLSVDGVFYSEEYPEFVGIQWNDAFIAELGSSTWAYSEAARDVTAPNNFAFDESGRLMEVNTVEFTNEDTGLEYDGSSKLLTAATPITSGPHSIYFSIYDAGDHNVDSAVFLDNLRTSQSADCASGAVKADSDGDGLPDRWEQEGYDANGDGQVDVDLPAMGADPERKDLFVQLDAMKGLRMSAAAIEKVTNAFASAPVSNPDGSTGVALHVDNGPGSVMNPQTGAKWGALSRASDIGLIPSLGFFHSNGSYDWGAFDSVKHNRFLAAREPIFHYALSVDRYGGSTSTGISRGIGASDFIVALGLLCSPEAACPGPLYAQAGTFMHELGHNLGLQHGGQDGVNRKPNYLSVMNYAFQFTGVLGGGIDYSRFDGFDLPDLEEWELLEPTGFNTSVSGRLTVTNCDGGLFGSDYWQTVKISGPVDFNCDNDTNDTSDHEDLNRDGSESALRSYDDWRALQFKGGAVGGEGLGVLLPEETTMNEPTVAQVEETSEVLVPPPTLAAEGVTGITAAAADVQATVNPRGNEAEVAVQYGRDAGYGDQTSFVPLGEGLAPIPVTLHLGGLQGGIYHYQLIVRSPQYLLYSPDGSFDTSASSVPPPVGQAFLPIGQPSPPVKRPLTCRKGFKKKRAHGRVHCAKVKHRHRHRGGGHGSR
jgi:hypothetical protein